MLARKDDASVLNAELEIAKRMPGLKKGMSRTDVKFYQQKLLADATFYNMASTKCIELCFKGFGVPTVAQKESDCMTNCTMKAMETYTHFRIADE